MLVAANITMQFGAKPLFENVNVKFGDGAQKYNDCRDCNPWAPFTSSGVAPHPANGPLGLTGYEPLGRFRAGPIGMANKEDEVSVTVRYKF